MMLSLQTKNTHIQIEILRQKEKRAKMKNLDLSSIWKQYLLIQQLLLQYSILQKFRTWIKSLVLLKFDINQMNRCKNNLNLGTVSTKMDSLLQLPPFLLWIEGRVVEGAFSPLSLYFQLHLWSGIKSKKIARVFNCLDITLGESQIVFFYRSQIKINAFFLSYIQSRFCLNIVIILSSPPQLRGITSVELEMIRRRGEHSFCTTNTFSSKIWIKTVQNKYNKL